MKKETNRYCNNRKCKEESCEYYFYKSPMNEVLRVFKPEIDKNGNCKSYKKDAGLP